jgi:hypothetical protein
MAESHDAHGHEDPNASPMHPEVHESFSRAAVLFCYALAAIALVAGLVAGLTVIND